MNIPERPIRPARPDDFPAILALLKECHLNADDLSPARLPEFFVAESGAVLQGVCGVEVFGRDAVLRSLAVTPDQRKQQLGAALVARCEAAARGAGIERLYLLTTTAAAYLRRLGYIEVPRDSVPPVIMAHPQFDGLCPASATCLAKLL